jgi:hypothetical protein
MYILDIIVTKDAKNCSAGVVGNASPDIFDPIILYIKYKE